MEGPGDRFGVCVPQDGVELYVKNLWILAYYFNLVSMVVYAFPEMMTSFVLARLVIIKSERTMISLLIKYNKFINNKYA
jgi:hypothetical protein